MCAKRLCGLALSMMLCCVLDSSHARADETENLLPKVVPSWETRKRLPVFEPDGSPENKDVQVVAGPRFARFEIGEALEIVGRVGFLEGNGDLLIDFDDQVEFVAIISEKGFFHFAVSRLKFLESIRLQPWSQLDVTDLANKPAEDGNGIIVTSVLTTDAMHQGLMMVRRGVTDREDIVGRSGESKYDARHRISVWAHMGPRKLIHPSSLFLAGTQVVEPKLQLVASGPFVG